MNCTIYLSINSFTNWLLQQIILYQLTHYLNFMKKVNLLSIYKFQIKFYSLLLNKVYLQFCPFYLKMIGQEESEIIQLVVTIFQNVGIKRCIDKIDILKNYQIYFEICKVIFPQTMIQLLRFSQGPQTNSQKIQGVISIVGKILQNDLYHISGQSISEGKLSHIRNFLHILELLSQNVHKGNRNEQQVESAPQNTRSISDYDQEGHYTVIGIDREFQREFEDQQGIHKENGLQQDTKRQYPNHHVNYQSQPDENSQVSDSQSERPMIPVLDNNKQNLKKNLKSRKTKKKQIPQIRGQQGKQTQLIKHNYIVPKIQQRHRDVPIPRLQNFLKPHEQKQQIRKKFKSNYVKKVNNIIEDFQAKRLTDLKLEHNIWVRKNQIKNSQKQNQIDQQNKQRIEFANELIVQRKKKIETLKNAKWAVNLMSNLFKQQRQIWKGMKRAKQQSQLEQISFLTQTTQRDEQLLRDALISGNPENFARKRK